jgi:hypothetical protein
MVEKGGIRQVQEVAHEGGVIFPVIRELRIPL